MAAVAVVQGASRGLGLAFCRHILLHRPSAALVATCRRPSGAATWRAVGAGNPGRVTVPAAGRGPAGGRQGGGGPRSGKRSGRADLVVNCSATLHPSGKGETSLRDVSAEDVMATLTTNSVGPLLMAKYFCPLLQRGGGKFGQQHPEKAKQHSGILINMTARVGSIGDNVLGGWYSYRMSKAALNMATKNLSIELGRNRQKVVCVSLHPGTVDTDLSRPYHKNVPKNKLFSADYSVQCLMSIIDRLNIDKTGKAYAWDGSEIPW
uniref:C-factor n=1 Tax=Denticeps clupeoides TaxID=299321 RepID=A0AAY4BV36_9TELE